MTPYIHRKENYEEEVEVKKQLEIITEEDEIINECSSSFNKLFTTTMVSSWDDVLEDVLKLITRDMNRRLTK